MKFFDDLNKYADNPLDAVRVPDVARRIPRSSTGYDSVVLTDNPMPEGADPARMGGSSSRTSSRAAGT